MQYSSIYSPIRDISRNSNTSLVVVASQATLIMSMNDPYDLRLVVCTMIMGTMIILSYFILFSF